MGFKIGVNFLKCLFKPSSCKQLAKHNSTSGQTDKISSLWNRLYVRKNQQLLKQENTPKLGHMLTRGKVLKSTNVLTSVQMFCNSSLMGMKQMQTAAYSTAPGMTQVTSIVSKYPRVPPMISSRDIKSVTSPVVNINFSAKPCNRRQMRPVYLSHIGRRRYLRMRYRRRRLVNAMMSRQRYARNRKYMQSKQLLSQTSGQSVIEQLQQMLAEAMRGSAKAGANPQTSTSKVPISTQPQRKNHRRGSSLSMLLPAYRPKRKSLRRNMRL